MPKSFGRISGNFFEFVNSPVVIGRYPLGTTDAEKAQLLEQVERHSRVVRGLSVGSFHVQEF